VLLGVLTYLLVARSVTVVAERRKDLRLYNGSDTPYSVSEAYVLWLLFGPLGAHRYYCGQRDSTLLIYACTLGLGGIGWLADGLWTAGLVVASNRRSPSAHIRGTTGAKSLRHIELTDFSEARERGNSDDTYDTRDTHDTHDTRDRDKEMQQRRVDADTSSEGWKAVVANALTRNSLHATSTPHPSVISGAALSAQQHTHTRSSAITKNALPHTYTHTPHQALPSLEMQRASLEQALLQPHAHTDGHTRIDAHTHTVGDTASGACVDTEGWSLHAPPASAATSTNTGCITLQHTATL